MNNQIWKIKKEKMKKTNLFLYSDFIEKNFNIDIGDNYDKLWKWSINNPKIFWKSIWDFTKVKGNLGNTLLQESDTFYKTRFFPDTKLNYAENLLAKNDSEIAIIFRSENGFKTIISWRDLNLDVQKISNWMKSNGIKK